MSQSHDATEGEEGTTVESYVLDVRLVEYTPDETGASRYRFEATHHEGKTFETLDTARLYADVYFDVNGFEEAGTGDRGVPPEIIQAGRDTLVAYFLTQPGTDVHWVASFYGEKPEKIERYASRVRKRAARIRAGAREHGLE